MQAVVLAGGRGTRLGSALPKPLVPLCGVPALVHGLSWLAREGVRDIVLCVGFGAAEIEQAVGDGAGLGVRIRYSREQAPLGTAGAVRAALGLLEERFLVVYADVIADLDVGALLAAHERSAASGTLVVHPNDHPFDSDRVVVDSRGFIERMVAKEVQAGPEAGALCSAALYVLERAFVQDLPDDGEARDFARDVFPAALTRGVTLFAYRTPEYLKDMGTPARREKVEADLRGGVPAQRRRRGSRAAVLVDRDGVLTPDTPFLTRHSDLSLLDGVAEVVAGLNRKDVVVACCTNQPVVARGELSEEGLASVHRRLEGLLGERGAWLDAIYACPHHPHRGFPGERAELKRACACRKPQPGMLEQAISELGIDRRACVFVGDRTIDLAAARAAGVVGIGVTTGAALKDGACAVPPESLVVRDLAQAAAVLTHAAPSWAPLLSTLGLVSSGGPQVVLIGGPSRAGKTLVANALRLALSQRGERALHLSLDRFIQPASRRRAEAPFEERVGHAAAARAVTDLLKGKAALWPGYDPRTREDAGGQVVQWDRRSVLILDGLLVLALAVPGHRVAVHAEDGALEERRRELFDWKGLGSRGLTVEAYERGRGEEDRVVRASLASARLHVAVNTSLEIKECA